MKDAAHRLKLPVSEEDWSRGPAEAPVTLVEYLDFACSHCRRVYPMLKRIVDDRGSYVRFVVRHFPLSRAHPQAENAARAVEAAGRQGQFWEMYHLLFAAKGPLAHEALLRYAGELGLDIKRFLQDLENPDLTEKIKKQKHLGLRSGVNGTPTFFINGLRYDGSMEEGPLRKALQVAARGVIKAAT